MQVTMNIDDLGTLLRVWRSQARLSTREVSARMSKTLGRKVSYMTVTRYEANEFPRGQVDPAVLFAMTVALNHRASDLPRKYGSSIDRLQDAMTKNRCFVSASSEAA